MHGSCPEAESSISWPDKCKLVMAKIIRRHILQQKTASFCCSIQTVFFALDLFTPKLQVELNSQ